MQRAWALVLLILLLVFNFVPKLLGDAPARLAIDHVTVCGADLDAMRQAFARVGLRTEYSGPHAGSPTHMAQLGFADGSYLELIAPLEKNQPLPERSPWPKEIEGNAGPCGWTINVRQIEAEVVRFRERGIRASTPVPGGRMRSDHVEMQWETAALAYGEDPRLPFLIQDHTPHALRAGTSAAVKRTELTGVAVVVLGVRDLQSSTALFRRAFGWAEPVVRKDATLGATVAYFPGMPVALAAPLTSNSWLSQRIEKFGERPAALLIGTRDFAASSGRFHVTATQQIAGRRIGWLNAAQLRGVRVGIVGQ